ncbi:DUF418 domain-containing protein [Streptomyces olivaceoviridis]
MNAPVSAARTDGRADRATTRVEAVDVLRGFALFGICMVNAPVIAGTFTSPAQQAQTPVDHVTTWLITALFTMKFYLIFSFLFGYSFTLLQRTAELRQADFGRIHGRRMLGLFVIGLAHAVLLYPGDILMTYAALGLLLFAVRDWRPSRILRAVAVLVAAVAAVLLVIAVFVLYVPADSATDVPATYSAAYRGGPLDVIGAHLREFREALAGALLYAGHLLAGLLAGLAAGRLRLLEVLVLRTAGMRRLALIGLAVGLPGSVFMALCEDGPLDGRYLYLGRAVGVVTAPALAAAYCCLLLWWLRTPGGRFRALLAGAGRLALTHYLVQSLVFALLFTGYGLGLYGTTGAAAVAVCSLLLYSVQLLLSGPILVRYGRGPAERLLRRLTHGPSGAPAPRQTPRDQR